MADKPAVDWEAIERRAAELLASKTCPTGNESDLVRLFCELEEQGRHDEAIGTKSSDTIVREMVFRFGRADIVVFHQDGAATVIEAKDGAKGYNHVVAGIGQVGLYAAQLAMTRGAITRVRRALMWTSTGDQFLDALIAEVCDQAGVVPVPWPSSRVLAANCAAVREAVSPGER